MWVCFEVKVVGYILLFVLKLVELFINVLIIEEICLLMSEWVFWEVVVFDWFILMVGKFLRFNDLLRLLIFLLCIGRLLIFFEFFDFLRFVIFLLSFKFFCDYILLFRLGKELFFWCLVLNIFVSCCCWFFCVFFEEGWSLKVFWVNWFLKIVFLMLLFGLKVIKFFIGVKVFCFLRLFVVEVCFVLFLLILNLWFL